MSKKDEKDKDIKTFYDEESGIFGVGFPTEI